MVKSKVMVLFNPTLPFAINIGVNCTQCSIEIELNIACGVFI